MTYQPYPTGTAATDLTPGPPQPRAIAIAVRLMYAGAGLQVLGIILSLLTIPSLKSAILKKYPSYTASQVHSAEVGGIVSIVLIGLVGIGLWLWMAQANGAGKRYARIVATVLFVLYTVDVLISLGRAQEIVGFIFGIVTWLVGLGAALLLWRRDSSAYYNHVPYWQER